MNLQQLPQLIHHLVERPPVPTTPWNDKMQPASLLSDNPDGTVTLSGVRWGYDTAPKYENWKPRFQDTVIDPSQVKNVYACVSRFQPTWMAAHDFLVFEFDPKSPMVAANGETDNRLVFGMDARLHEGQKFDKIDGTKKQYGDIIQLSTWKDVVQFACYARARGIESYPMKLSDKEKQELLAVCLQDAVTDHSRDFYHTINNNCTTRLVDNINEVRPGGHRIGHAAASLIKPVTAIPTTLPLLLDAHGLILPGSQATITMRPGALRMKDKPVDPQWYDGLVKAAQQVTTDVLSVVTGHPVGLGVRAAFMDLKGEIFESSDKYVPKKGH